MWTKRNVVKVNSYSHNLNDSRQLVLSLPVSSCSDDVDLAI